MKNYLWCSFRMYFAGALILSTLSASAAVLPYTLKVQSSRAASVESIHAIQDKERTLVSGLVRISPAYSDSTVGHLCVTVISKDGKVLSDTPIRYNMNLHGKNLSMAQWKVPYVASVNAPAGSTIVVSHHNSRLTSTSCSHPL